MPTTACPDEICLQCALAGREPWSGARQIAETHCRVYMCCLFTLRYKYFIFPIMKVHMHSAYLAVRGVYYVALTHTPLCQNLSLDYKFYVFRMVGAYLSGSERSVLICLSCSKWLDMSVAKTMSITSPLTSAKSSGFRHLRMFFSSYTLVLITASLVTITVFARHVVRVSDPLNWYICTSKDLTLFILYVQAKV